MELKIKILMVCKLVHGNYGRLLFGHYLIPAQKYVWNFRSGIDCPFHVKAKNAHVQDPYTCL